MKKFLLIFLFLCTIAHAQPRSGSVPTQWIDLGNTYVGNPRTIVVSGDIISQDPLGSHIISLDIISRVGADNTYLRLDCTNSPLTGDLGINVASPLGQFHMKSPADGTPTNIVFDRFTNDDNADNNELWFSLADAGVSKWYFGMNDAIIYQNSLQIGNNNSAASAYLRLDYTDEKIHILRPLLGGIDFSTPDSTDNDSILTMAEVGTKLFSLRADFAGGGAGNRLKFYSDKYSKDLWEIDGDGHIRTPIDGAKRYFGAADDASINYNGSNMIINPREAGTGWAIVDGLYTGLRETTNVGIGDSLTYSAIATGAIGNVALGSQALRNLTTGDRNMCIGTTAGRDIVTATDNVFVGNGAGVKVTGNGNLALGTSALAGDTNTAILDNVAIGSGALRKGSTRSVGIGQSAGWNTLGNANVMIGYLAGFTNADEDLNTIIGAVAGYSNSGENNVFLGAYSGYLQSTTDNTLLIDNQERGSAAEELAESIIYGVMAAAPANQTLTVNAKVISTGGRIVNTTRVATTYTVLVTDHVVYCDTDGGAFTSTLPAGVDGQEFFITNCGSAGLALTLDGNGAETINGDLTQLLYDGESVHIVYETTEGWRVF